MDISNRRQQVRIGLRGGATVLAVLIVLTLACLMAHQTVRTLYLLRQSQTASAKLAQAREVLELGKMLEVRLRGGDTTTLLAGPILVKFGQQYAKLEFSTVEPSAIQVINNAESKTITRVVATWPIASNGAEVADQIPNVVTYEILR